MYTTQSPLRKLSVMACMLLTCLFLTGGVQAQHATPDLSSIPVEELTPDQAVELFKTLPAPTMEEMNGEFAGEMLSFPTLYTSIFWTIASNNPIYPGVWQGKSFKPTGPNEGRGYNTVERWFTQTIDIWPMLTRIGPSYFDGKPSFQLVYRAFDHYAGDIHMLDEVRRLPDGRYLGIGRTGTSTEERRLAMPFLLGERIGDYRQDIGEPREGFDMAAELELLEFPPSAYRDTAQ